MIVALPFCHKDYARTQELLRWMADLDGKLSGHHALLVASSQAPQDGVDECVKLAQAVFGKVTAIRQRDVEESGWPRSCNRLFQLAASYVQQHLRQPFYWMENDVVPLRPGWLSALEREYQRAGKPFMGVIYEWVSATRRLPHLTGCAIYPADIQRYNPAALAADSVPWDCTQPAATLRFTHGTPLMQHEWGDRATNEAPTFPDASHLMLLHSDAVVFHRCKDGSLIQRLREKLQLAVRLPSVPLAELALRSAGRALRGLLRGGSSYYHSGNLGDIVYALYAISLHGGGELFLGPQQNQTSPCGNPVSREQFELLLPLLRRQSYLRQVEFAPEYPRGKFRYDLNTFRNYWNDHRLRRSTGIDNLCEMHCHTLGVRHLMQSNEPWLEAGPPIATGKVIVHRSARYRAKDFPWRRVVDQLRPHLLFIGTETEHRDFEQDFGRVSFWKVRELDEMARVIAGGVSFVGNQSFPCSLALAMGQYVVQESWAPSQDCLFRRSTFMNQHYPAKDWEEWFNLVC